MAWEDRPYYREDGAGGFGMRAKLGFTPPTPVAMGIMVACFGVFVVQAITGDFRTGKGLSEWCALTFTNAKAFTQPWRWITYQYLHGDAWHIFFNLIFIYFLVPPLERVWGGRATFLFYTAGGIAAGALFGFITLFIGPGHELIGASGSIFAMLGAMALLYPTMQIMLFFLIPITLRALAVLSGVLWILLVVSRGDPSSAAHLGGLVFGFVAPYYGKDAFRNLAARFKQARERRTEAVEKDESEAIDRILQKVHTQGMNSLTRGEKKTLSRATERQRRAGTARRG